MSNNTVHFKTLTEKYLQEFIQIREHIHAHPELSFVEYNTAAFISEKLTEYGVKHKTGIAGTGIVGIIKGKNPEKKNHCIACRYGCATYYRSK